MSKRSVIRRAGLLVIAAGLFALFVLPFKGTVMKPAIAGPYFPEAKPAWVDCPDVGRDIGIITVTNPTPKTYVVVTGTSLDRPHPMQGQQAQRATTVAYDYLTGPIPDPQNPGFYIPVWKVIDQNGAGIHLAVMSTAQYKRVFITRVTNAGGPNDPFFVFLDAIQINDTTPSLSQWTLSSSYVARINRANYVPKQEDIHADVVVSGDSTKVAVVTYDNGDNGELPDLHPLIKCYPANQAVSTTATPSWWIRDTGVVGRWIHGATSGNALFVCGFSGAPPPVPGVPGTRRARFRALDWSNGGSVSGWLPFDETADTAESWFENLTFVPGATPPIVSNPERVFVTGFGPVVNFDEPPPGQFRVTRSFRNPGANLGVSSGDSPQIGYAVAAQSGPIKQTNYATTGGDSVWDSLTGNEFTVWQYPQPDAGVVGAAFDVTLSPGGLDCYIAGRDDTGGPPRGWRVEKRDVGTLTLAWVGLPHNSTGNQAQANAVVTKNGTGGGHFVYVTGFVGPCLDAEWAGNRQDGLGMFTIAYNENGTFLWQHRYDGDADHQCACGS